MVAKAGGNAVELMNIFSGQKFQMVKENCFTRKAVKGQLDLVNITCCDEIGTGSDKIIQRTISKQGGVVNEPLQEKKPSRFPGNNSSKRHEPIVIRPLVNAVYLGRKEMQPQSYDACSNWGQFFLECGPTANQFFSGWGVVVAAITRIGETCRLPFTSKKLQIK
uniref:Uncharacterized protein n=1 Tax=Romanomermis culicivorax TaxID=13658 RepID=A0A915INS0_ROMCU